MRKLIALLVPVLAALAVAPPALAEPTWANPVSIFTTTPLIPGSTVACFGNPSAGGMPVTATNATYAWTRDEVAIAGETTGWYSVRNSDLGHQLRCQMSVDTVEGPLSGTSEAILVPVSDDGPPRPLPHSGASLDGGGGIGPVIAAMNVPAVIGDVGPVSEAWFCKPGLWSGINGPTATQWTFEFLRDGVVVETITRDGNQGVVWRGYPAGWVDTSRGGLPQYLAFAAWHRRTAADPGQSIQCRVTVTNGVGQFTSTSQAAHPAAETPAEPEPAKITAKPASGVLRRGSFKVAYTGKGKLSAKVGKTVVATGSAKVGKTVVATGSAKGGKATLKLTAAGRKLLKRKRRVTVTITAGATRARVTVRASPGSSSSMCLRPGSPAPGTPACSPASGPGCGGGAGAPIRPSAADRRCGEMTGQPGS
jgi:hypothetical protein